MTAGSEIVAEIAAALGEASAATGGKPLTCVIQRPATGGSGQLTPRQKADAAEAEPTLYEVGATRTTKQIRDGSGVLIGQAKTVLLIEATGVAPLKSDRIAVDILAADVTEDTTFHKVDDIQTLAPGDTALMFKVTLAD